MGIPWPWLALAGLLILWVGVMLGFTIAALCQAARFGEEVD